FQAGECTGHSRLHHGRPCRRGRKPHLGWLQACDLCLCDDPEGVTRNAGSGNIRIFTRLHAVRHTRAYVFIGHRMNTTLTVTDMHTGGEPLRIVTGGYPAIPAGTILEKRAYVRDHLDHLRKILMFEPRGHYDMYGALLVEPDLPGADLAVL